MRKSLSHANGRILGYFAKTFLLAVLLFFSGIVSGQTLPYTFTQSTGTYTPISGGTVFQSGSTVSVDLISGSISLPFTFVYNGISCDRIYISNNGFITLANSTITTAPSNTTYNPISATTGYLGAVAGYAFNLQQSTVSTAASEIRYEAIGSSPARVFVIQYTDMARSTNPTSERLTFQIRLSETSNKIEIVYDNPTVSATGFTASNFGQVGLRGSTNNSFSNRMVYATAPYSTWASSGAAGNNGGTPTVTTAPAGGPNVMPFSTTYKPTAGLTYSWTPISSVFYQAIPYTQNFESAWQNGTSVQDVPTSSGVLTMPGTGNGSVRAHDASTTNSVWSGTSGSFGSLGTAQGSRAARFHTFGYSSGLKSYMDLYLNFSSSIGAKTLNFDYINPTGSDVLNIYLSTDGGITFGSSLLSNGVASGWTARSVSLGSSTSSTCVVRFEFTSDFGSDDIGIDNINVSVPVPCSKPDAPTLTSNTIASTSLNLVITPPLSNVPNGGYLVVRSLNATAPNLINGISYSGDSTYTIVSNGTTTSIAQTGLVSNTQYYYYVYSQNTGCAGAPFYSSVATISPVTCAGTPTSLVNGAITSNSFTGSWTAPAGGSAGTITYTMEVHSNATFTSPVGSVTGAGTTNTVSGLNPSTQYYWRVKANNGSCDSSYASGTTFTTACAAVTVFPWTEGFEGVTIGTTVVGTSTSLPSCWNSGSTQYSTTTATTYNGPKNGTKYLRYPWSTTNAYIWTPGFQLTAGVSYDFSFNAQGDGFTTWVNDVFVNSSQSSTGATQLTPTYSPTGPGSAAIQPYALVKRTFVPSTSGVYYFSIRGNQSSSSPWYMAFDDFRLELTPTDAVDYANIQYPGVSTTTTGTSVDIFGQAYEPGVTEAGGPGTGLVVWYSKNATDVDPSSAAWTGAWTLATYNAQGGPGNNNDEWKGTITPISGQADTYYSFRYQLNGGPMKYGGYPGSGTTGFWDGTTNKNGKLSVNYDVYTTAVAPNNTVNNTIDVYFKDFVPGTDFYTSGQTEVWMYAGAHVGATTFNHVGTQNFADRSTLVKFVQQSDPTLYKATIKFADVLCINNTTDIITGIDLNFQNQYYTSGGVGSNNQTANLFLDLTDAAVAVNAPTITATTGITTTTATINWTAPTTGTIKGYEYYYSTSNSTPGASPTPIGSTATGITTASLTSLTPGTQYYFWVRTKGCSPLVSAWSAVGNFTTTNVPTTYTWNGATSTSWDVATNWTKSGGGNGIPTSIDSVIITGTAPNMLTVASNKTVTNFELSGSNSNSFTISGINALTITGNVTYSGTASAVLNCGSTVNITNASNQPVPPLTYGNLNVTGGNRTLSPTGTIKICSAFSVNPTLYTYTVTGSTVEYISSTSGWTMAPFTYNNLTFSGTGDFALEKGTINVGGNFVQSAGTFYLGYLDDATLNIIGNMTIGNSVNNSRDAFYATINVGGDLNIINGGSLLSYAGTTDAVNVTGNTNISGTGSWSIWSDVASTATIGGNLTLTGTSANAIEIDGQSTINVNGDFSQSNTSKLYLSDGIISVFNVGGNFTLAGTSEFDLNLVSGGNTTVNLKGNLSVASTAILKASNTNQATFNFNRTTGTVQNINVQSAVAAVDFVVGSQASVKLLNSLQITGNTSLTVNGVFDADDKILSGNSNVNQALTIAATGRLKTANTLGFSGGTATSVVTSGTNDINAITLTSGSTIEYTRAGDQAVTNQSFGTAPNDFNYQNLEISGSGVKTATVGNVKVNQMTKLTSAGAELLVPSPVSATPNVFYALGGIDNGSGATGVFHLASDAQLIQHTATRNDASNTNAKIKADREITTIQNTASQMDYVYWSSPVEGNGTSSVGQLFNAFSPNTPTSGFIEYRESNDYFYPTSDTTFKNGKGYAIRAESGITPNANKTYSFAGKPNNGAVTFAGGLKKSSATTQGYNMVGNPYPSNIDADKVFTDNAGIYTTVFFWSNKNYNFLTQQGSTYDGSNYSVYSVLGGVPATYPASATVVTNNVIKVGQGFLVQKKDVGTSDFVFNNNMRITNNGDFYQKTSATKDRFWLTLKSPNDLINTTLIGYLPEAQNAYDKNYDVEVLSFGMDALYSVIGSEKLTIQARQSPVIDSDVVPLGASHNENGVYQIAIQTPEGVFADGKAVYLLDKLTNTYTHLQEQNYTYNAIAGVTEDRFEIVYKNNEVLGTDGAGKSDFAVYRDGGSFVIKSSKVLGKIELYDVSGKLIRATSSKEKEFRLDAVTLPSGVYVIRAENSGNIRTKKIIK